MSSCNVLSLIWAISPISTAGCAEKTSCNAALAKVTECAAGSMACAWRLLVTQALNCLGAASSPDARRATPALARRSPTRGSNRGYRTWPASGAGSPPCSPCGTRAASNTADAGGFSDRAGINPHSTGTCVVFRASSIRPPRGGSCRADAHLTWIKPDRKEETKETAKKEETASDRKNRRRSTKKNRDVQTAAFT